MRRRVLTPHPGLSTDIGYYLSGMEEVRSQLVCCGEDNSRCPDRQAAIPRRPFNRRTRVAHRRSRVVLDPNGRRRTPAHRRRQAAPCWDILDDVERVSREGFTTEFCLEEIRKIRNQTRDLLFTYNDKDLERTIHYERQGKPTEHNLRWILHHLIDHEAQHKGQILMLKRLMATLILIDDELPGN